MGRGIAKEELKDIRRRFQISLYDLRAIVANFHVEMDRGLQSLPSSLKMLPAYIDIPSRKEKGRYIALDLGGTNFRVLQVKLGPKGRIREEYVSKFMIPKAVMHGTGLQLFNFIARSIETFLLRHNIDFDGKRHLGFTFSFPMQQTNIAKGILINWTKEFSASGVVGRDVVELLKRSLNKFDLKNIRVTALANDTVGTMMAKAYQDPNCDVGIIFGTGTNACYREAVANIRKIPREGLRAHNCMVINTEWGNFNRLPINDYDRRLDSATNNPGEQQMEKMVSGMYLGELTRHILMDLIKQKILFPKSKSRFTKGDFLTRHMSLIELDRTKGLTKIKNYLESVGILDTKVAERELMKRICKIVSKRAARVSAASISAVVTWMDPELKNKHTIGIDGTLYERYPGFRSTMIKTLADIHGKDAKKIKLVRAKDGSGVGVAIVAAVVAS